MESIDIKEMDCDNCPKMQKILSDEIDDPKFLEFAIENFSEMMGHIAQGNLNIRIRRLLVKWSVDSISLVIS